MPITRETHNSDWFVKNLGSGGMIFRKPRPQSSADSSPDTQSAVPQEWSEQIAQEAKEQMSATASPSDKTEG